jgi:divalent metal cation (Fe/Co/Zn/Cd) transporter
VVSILIGKAAAEMVLPGAEDPHGLCTRRVGPNVVIEIHVRVSPDASVAESHDITEEIEVRLRSRFGDGTLTTVHVEPAIDGGKR